MKATIRVITPDAGEVLAEARSFAKHVYGQAPLRFGLFVNKQVIEETIETMIMRGFVEGTNAVLRRKVKP